MSLVLSGVSFRYQNQNNLFESISLSIGSGSKVSIVGNNGTGKSTLLRIAAGLLVPYEGSVRSANSPYYVPQQVGLHGVSVCQALGVAPKVEALHAIYAGSEDHFHYEILDDDWDIEARCQMALDEWGLANFSLTSPIDSLSGGEKSKLFLAGMLIHKPSIILLDEPTNHLDRTARQQLYSFVRTTKAAVVVVSHDVTLLNLVDDTYELSSRGLRHYGGCYDHYREQKDTETSALKQQVEAQEASLRLARKRAQEVRERQEKRASQGEKNKDQVIRILRKSVKNSGENTGAKLNEKHQSIVQDGQRKLSELRGEQAEAYELRIDFDNARLHHGKRLIAAKGVNVSFDEHTLWEEPLSLEVISGERIAIEGDNGTGKTTLIRLLSGRMEPHDGEVFRSDFTYVYLDQEYSLVSSSATVLELASCYNHSHLEDHEVKMRLHRALFPKEMWDRPCDVLSGGEKMRLYLCCLMISNHIPDIFILDEPTNNLDLASLQILTSTIRDYKGTLLVVSHDQQFVNDIGITRQILLRRSSSASRR